jgi:tetratricopeptide (TPR) repeat protein
MVTDGWEAGRRRPPTPSAPRRSRLGGSLLLVALGAFGLTRFATSGSDAGRVEVTTAVDPTSAKGTDVARLEAAVAANPRDLEALQALGIAYVRAAPNAAENYIDPARATFDRADSIVMNDPGTLVGRGLLSLSLHQFADARAFATRVLADNPDIDAARLVLVDALVELGRYDDAERELDVLLDSDPGLPAYSRVSYLRQLHGDLDGAISTMRQAATAGSSSPTDEAEVRAFLGELLLLRHDASAAAAEFDRALQLYPGLALAELGRARISVDAGRIDDAVERLEVLTRRLPLPAALTLLGVLYEQRGDDAAAQRAYDLVRASYEGQSEIGENVDMEMAVFEAEHGDASLALDLARKAHAARPSNVFVADAVAWATFKTGAVDAAKIWAAEALRLGSIDRGISARSATLL